MATTNLMILTPLSIVIPVYNESENISPLFQQIKSIFDPKKLWQVVFVDDGSQDESVHVLDQLQSSDRDHVTVIHKTKNQGQSAAIYSGVLSAKFDCIATLDGDGQNDPCDIPALIMALVTSKADPVLIAGIRQHRKDSILKRTSSRIANRVRQWVLHDDCVDTGCGIKVFRKHEFLQLPYFDHMHRFLPALWKRCLGGNTVCVPVSHHPRLYGETHYGVNNRLWAGIVDMLGVIWICKRHIPGLYLPCAFPLSVKASGAPETFKISQDRT